jgi:hypothetical protein
VYAVSCVVNFYNACVVTSDRRIGSCFSSDHERKKVLIKETVVTNLVLCCMYIPMRNTWQSSFIQTESLPSSEIDL